MRILIIICMLVGFAAIYNNIVKPITSVAPVVAQTKPKVERKPIPQAWDYRDDDTDAIKEVRRTYIENCRGEVQYWTDKMCSTMRSKINQYDFMNEASKLVKVVTE